MSRIAQHPEILLYGDERLRLPCFVVTTFNDRIAEIGKRLERVRGEAHAAALAAPQIGEMIRMVEIDLSVGRFSPQSSVQSLVMVNPVIVNRRGTQTGAEGCMSFPGFTETVERSEVVEVEYFNVYGKKFWRQFSGFLARAAQHEIDHLDGVLLIDHVNDQRVKQIEKGMRRLREKTVLASEVINADRAFRDAEAHGREAI